MTILITGATSGLGRNAAEILHAQGKPLRATGRNVEVGHTLRAAGMDFVAADLAAMAVPDMQSMLDGVDTIWHCAALSAPWGPSASFHAINVAATERLAQAAVAAGVRCFVHISTPSVYFDYRHHANVPESYRARRYANAYVRTKAMAEDMLSRHAARHPDTVFVILRPRALFGPHDRVLMPRVLRLLKQCRGTLFLPRGGQALMDLTFIPNAVYAMQLAGCCPRRFSGQAFNITNHDPRPLGWVLKQLLRDELNRKLELRRIPYPLADLAGRGMERWSLCSGREPSATRYTMGALNFDMTLDNTKAVETLGYKPMHTMDEGIRLTAKWIRNNGEDQHI